MHIFYKIKLEIEYENEKSFFSDLTYCLDNLVVDSNGITKDRYPSIMGKYSKYQEMNGKPLYKHVSNEAQIHEVPMIYWYSSAYNTRYDYWTVSKIIQAIIYN